MLRLITIFTLLVFLGAKSYSQSIDSEYKNSIKKILSSKYVSDVVEDLDGYIWIATDEGVYRYNGTKSIHFTTKKGLPTNDIIYLNVDSKNRVWLTGFYSGLYYIENRVVKKAANSDRAIDLAYGFEKNDTVYFHDKGVNNSYYYINGKLHAYKNKLFPKNKILEYYPKNNLTVEYDWYEVFINNKKVPINNDNEGTFLHYPNLKYGTPTFVKLLGSSNFPFIRRDFQNNFLAFENQKLEKYKIDNSLPEKDTIYHFGKFENKKHSIFLTSKNKIIVNTAGVYNKTLSNKINKLQFNFRDFYFVYIDSKNNFWFIDKKKSLCFVPNNFENSKILFSKNSFQNNQEYIIDFIKHNEYYIFATNNNKMFSFDSKTKQTKLIKDYKNDVLRNLYLKQDTLIVDQLRYINKYKIKDQNIIEISKSDKGYKTTSFFENEMYSSTNAIIYNSKFKEFWKEESNKNITTLKLNASHLYLTTPDNVIRLNKKTKASIKAPIKNGSSIAIIDNYIVVGTNEGKVAFFDKNLKLLEEFEIDEKIIDIIYDSYSKWIYIQTKKTITFYKKSNNNKLQFEYQINNLSNDDRIVGLCYDADFIYYSTESTITKIKKQQLIKPLKATLDIDNAVIISTNKSVNNNDLIQREENSLSFDISLKTYNSKNDFTVNYNLTHNGDIVIKDKKIKSENLTFYNLNPGNYTIQFKIVPKHGNSKPTYNTFSFYIDYFFWETIWFKILMLLVFAVTTILIIIVIRNRHKKKQKMISSLITLEQKALTAQMNPHFIFNALNNIQSSMILEGERAANKHFVNFSRLLRTTLDILNTEKIMIDDEIAYITSYINIEQVNSKEPIEIDIKIDEEIVTDVDMIPIMLLQPIVENSIVHGFNFERKNKKIKIEFIKNNNDTITIIIEDNGLGLKDDLTTQKKHKSYATKILKKRLLILSKLEKANYTIEIKNLNNTDENNITGTKTTLIVPIKK